MADPTLTQGQYSIGKEGSSSAFVYGGRVGTFANNIQIANTTMDSGTLAVQDQAVVGHDGMLFGVDTQPGMVITQTGQANAPNNPAAAMDAYNALAGAWNDPAIRLSSGTVAVLRAFYPGSSVVRRCYGRGRKIAPVTGQVWQGIVGFAAQFQSSDNTWYSDALSSCLLTQVPSFTGGLTPPVTPPYQLAVQGNFRQNTAVNSGSLPTWPVITFTGPITNPGLAYANTPVVIGWTGVLPTSSDTLVIDTRPWARTALMNGASVAGDLTGDPMISLQLQPGSTVMQFTGQDFTGTATCLVTWRNATQMMGGSS